MKSVMKKLYEYAPSIKQGRSVFDRSHSHKLTGDASRLIPIMWDEVLPGDTFKLNVTALIRLATPIVPVMDNLHVRTEFFFVPLRLIWTNAQRFFGERDPDPDSSIDYETPKINLTVPVDVHDIGDYLGIPPGVTPNSSFIAFPFRSYVKIFNDWYRSQDLDTSFTLPVDDGPDDITNYQFTLLRGKMRDYFTSCLPWPQKGDEVTLPLGEDAPVIGNGIATCWDDGTNEAYGFWNSTTSSLRPDLSTPGDPVGTVASLGSPAADKAIGLTTDPDHSGMIADLSDATAATINAIRQAFQLQRFKELEARGGSRYREIVYQFFGVDTGDARLQRTEFLGGSHHYMNVNPVQQTSSTDAVTPQGNLAAYGLYAGNAGGFYKSFTEHGIVMALCTVSADITYQQGIDREWWRNDRYDYFWPTFAHLGEQEVYNREIWIEEDATDDDVFGYQERYHEYRYKQSKISGQFRSEFAESLDVWHLSEDFAMQPVLNSVFLNDPTYQVLPRCLAVTEHGEEDYPQLLMDFYFDYKCERPMPTRSRPGFMDHF